MSYEKFKKAFLVKSKDFVENYDIDDVNKDAVKSILTYFAGIDTKKYPLNKGLLVHGCIGSGKTMLFKIVQQILKNFAINNVRDIVSEFNIGGFEAIDSYVKTKTRMFDDIGQENNGKYYGNDTNVVQELIIRRYEKFQNSGQITHFTTNFGVEKHFVKKYGERAFDRLTEMCSSIILGDNNVSRRDTYNPVIKTKIEESKIDTKELNLKAKINAIRLIYKGDIVLNAQYVMAYDYLKENKILTLSESKKKEITILAENELINARQRKIDRLSNSGNLSEARNLSKKIFDIKLELVSTQKKIAVIEFLNKEKNATQQNCDCENQRPNYPEMIWCDNCGKKIPQMKQLK